MPHSLIDVRIFGVPERMECIRLNQEILGVPDERIFIDETHEGCVKTAKRAWLAETDKPYTMVLQDDVELCDGFLSVCRRMIQAHPDVVFSLFPMEFNNWRKGGLPKESPYIAARYMSGQGILMKTEWVRPCVDSWDRHILGDDVNIQRWAENTGKTILTTVPCTLQHIGDVSVFDPTRSLGRSPYFQKDVSDVDWESDYITPWTNIAR